MIIFASTVMKLVQWVRFTWDLDKLPAIAPVLPLHYHFDEVSQPNEREVRAVIARSLAHDTTRARPAHDPSPRSGAGRRNVRPAQRRRVEDRP